MDPDEIIFGTHVLDFPDGIGELVKIALERLLYYL